MCDRREDIEHQSKRQRTSAPGADQTIQGSQVHSNTAPAQYGNNEVVAESHYSIPVVDQGRQLLMFTIAIFRRLLQERNTAELTTAVDCGQRAAISHDFTMALVHFESSIAILNQSMSAFTKHAAVAQNIMGDIYLLLGKYENTMEAYNQAQHLWISCDLLPTDKERVFNLVRISFSMGVTSLINAQLDRSVEFFNTSLSLLTSHFTWQVPDDNCPYYAPSCAILCQIHLHLGKALCKRRFLDMAMMHFKEYKTVASVPLAKNDDWLGMAKLDSTIGSELYLAGYYEQAIVFYTLCLDQLTTHYRSAWVEEKVSTMLRIADIHVCLSHYDQAVSTLKSVYEIRQRQHNGPHADLALTLDLLIDVYNKQNKYQNSVECALVRCDVLKVLHGEYSTEVAVAYSALAQLHEKCGDSVSSARLQCISFELRRKLASGAHSEEETDLMECAERHFASEDYTAASQYLVQCMNIQVSNYGATSIEVATTLHQLGSVCMCGGLFIRAREYYAKCLEMRKQLLGETHVTVAKTYNSLGILHRATGQYEQALKQFLESLRIQIDTISPPMASIATTLLNIACIRNNMGQLTKCLQANVDAYRVMRDYYGTESLPVADQMVEVAAVCNKMGEYDGSIKILNCALSIYRTASGYISSDVAMVLRALGVNYFDQGDHCLARERWLESDYIFTQCNGESFIPEDIPNTEKRSGSEDVGFPMF